MSETTLSNGKLQLQEVALFVGTIKDYEATNQGFIRRKRKELRELCTAVGINLSKKPGWNEGCSTLDFEAPEHLLEALEARIPQGYMLIRLRGGSISHPDEPQYQI